MTNLPDTPRKLELPAHMRELGWLVFDELTPEEKVRHEAKVAIFSKAILARFWSDENEPDEYRDIEMETWLDVIGKLGQDEIRAAWSDYQKTGPRTRDGKLYRPDPGAIYLRVMKLRKKQREAWEADQIGGPRHD
ncbi:MAG: hypothetical protein KDK53_05645 [Maritimibacter sp.]|nr:hypothetical protein [Maritimibacter sp.]